MLQLNQANQTQNILNLIAEKKKEKSQKTPNKHLLGPNADGFSLLEVSISALSAGGKHDYLQRSTGCEKRRLISTSV